MPRKICASLVAVAVAVIALAGLSTNASAQDDVSGTVYFQTQTFDNTLRTINPTTQPVSGGGFLCAMVYVFDTHEEMQECCGCRVTNDGLRVFSVRNDLTKNPLISNVPPFPFAGEVEVVSTLSNTTSSTGPDCNPALSYAPTPALRSYITHSGGNILGAGVAEVHLKDAHVGAAEIANLQSVCALIHTQGTGRGICTCGVGDQFAAQPGAGGR